MSVVASVAGTDASSPALALALALALLFFRPAASVPGVFAEAALAPVVGVKLLGRSVVVDGSTVALALVSLRSRVGLFDLLEEDEDEEDDDEEEEEEDTVAAAVASVVAAVVVAAAAAAAAAMVEWLGNRARTASIAERFAV